MSSTPSENALLDPVYRTVTPGYTSHEDMEMDIVGWVVLLGLLTLLFPLIPLFLAGVLVTKLIGAVRSQTSRSV